MEPSAAYRMLMATFRVMLKAVDARLVLEDGLGADGRKIFNEYLGIFPVMLPNTIELEECKGIEMMWRKGDPSPRQNAPRKVLLWMHGGGFAFCSTIHHRLMPTFF